MPLSRPRWLASVVSEHFADRSAGRVVETFAPSADERQLAWSSRIGRWLAASAWFAPTSESMPAMGRRRQSAELASARLEFSEALFDVRTDTSASLLDRIAVLRSLRELWDLRGEVFDHVSRRHGQSEAEDRLIALDAHFPERMRRAGFTARAPLIADDAAGLLRAHRRAGNDATSR